MDLVKLTSAFSNVSVYVAASEILCINVDTEIIGVSIIFFRHSKKVMYVKESPDEVYEILKKHEDDRYNSIFSTNEQFCYIGEKDVEGDTIE